MIERQLREQLEQVSRRIAWQRLLWRWSACWFAGALCAVVLILSPPALPNAPAVAAAMIAAGVGLLMATLAIRARRRGLDQRAAARAIERTFPELDDRLLAAAEQQPHRSTGRLSYLQRAVVENVLAHRRRHDWRIVVPRRRMLAAFAVQCAALAAFIGSAIVLLRHDAAATTLPLQRHLAEAVPPPVDDYGLTIEPGDVEIERGTSLLVLARFDGRLPSRASLIAAPLNALRRGSPDPAETPDRRSPDSGGTSASNTLEHREETFGRDGGVVGRPRHNANASRYIIELTRSLDDPLFGGRIPEVPNDLAYHVEYDGRRSVDYRVTVFDYPQLESADFIVTAPPYAGREPVTVSDARRISLLEGSQLTLVCHMNKPLAAATFQPPDGEPIPLQPTDGDELAWTVSLSSVESTRHQLLLTDQAGRNNKLPPEFVIDVIPNRPPDLKLTFPGKDVRVSPLEELSLEATAWDDIGLIRYGVVYALNGREETTVLGEGTAKQQDAALAHQLALEELAAEPDELLSYYFFADDHGPDGSVRRTASDMYFAEVRPFEEIYREGQQPPGGGGGAAGGGGPQGQKIEELAQLQKQIVNATWSLIRRGSSATASDTLASDVEAIAESQQAAITQLGELREKLNDARSQGFAGEAGQFMQQAIDHLRAPDGASQSNEGEEGRRTDFQSVRAPHPAEIDARWMPDGRSTTPSYGSATPRWSTATRHLEAALAAERAAYQSLLRLRAREHDVVRGQGGGGGGGGGGSPSQQQLNQLELTNKQNRYQTEQRAENPQPSLDREHLQVLNRLRELARRQSGVNQQLKELELALQSAQTAAEREELERRLKRLRDEQQEVLRDLDELRDRMDQSQNQQEMSDARRQVDQARQQVREASDALREGQVSQSISFGTRAERELENLREDFRRRTANQFADAMSELRDRAQELSQQQQQLGESLAELDTPHRRSLRDAEKRRELSGELTGQRDRLNDVLDRMRQVIEQAEHSEPLLSKQLYDAARQARADAPEKSLEAASQLTDRGLLTDARAAADQAQRGIDALRDGVRNAADAVLGNEVDALRRARDDVRDLAEDLNRELAQADRAENTSAPQQTADASQGGGQSADRPGGQPTRESQPSTGSLRPQPTESSQNADPADGAERPADAAGQPPGDGAEQPSGDSAAPMAGQSGGAGSSASQNPMESTSSGSGQGQGSQSESDGPGRGSSQSPSQRPSLLSNGGQAGGPGEGPGGRSGPLTGGEFQQWSDRMRDVEETVGDPELRDAVSRIRERARSVRAEFKRHSEEPNWDLVRGEILEPLLELEDRLAEEISHRESPDALVPIDRDPVPARFAEAVREYYEGLGNGRR